MLRSLIRCIDGQAMVEFATSLPVILLLLMGIIEFSKLGGTLLLVSHGAREGARAASLGANDAAIVQTVVGSTVILDGEKLDIEIIPDDSRPRDEKVTVVVGYPVNIGIPIISQLIGTPRWVRVALTMRVE
jgi:hypothetical protein